MMENAAAVVSRLEARSLLALPSEEKGVKALGRLASLVSDVGGELAWSRLALRRRRAPRENVSFQSSPSFRHSSVIR